MVLQDSKMEQKKDPDMAFFDAVRGFIWNTFSEDDKKKEVEKSAPPPDKYAAIEEAGSTSSLLMTEHNCNLPDGEEARCSDSMMVPERDCDWPDAGRDSSNFEWNGNEEQEDGDDTIPFEELHQKFEELWLINNQYMDHVPTHLNKERNGAEQTTDKKPAPVTKEEDRKPHSKNRRSPKQGKIVRFPISMKKEVSRGRCKAQPRKGLLKGILKTPGPSLFTRATQNAEKQQFDIKEKKKNQRKENAVTLFNPPQPKTDVKAQGKIGKKSLSGFFRMKKDDDETTIGKEDPKSPPLMAVRSSLISFSLVGSDITDEENNSDRTKRRLQKGYVDDARDEE